MIDKLKNKQPPNKVWIELDRPRDEAHAEQIAELINKVMRKIEPTNTREFFWDAKERVWCIGDAMGYVTLNDNGEWFNLDYLGKD